MRRGNGADARGRERGGHRGARRPACQQGACAPPGIRHDPPARGLGYPERASDLAARHPRCPCGEHCEDELLRIRPVGHDAFRQHRVRRAAARALHARHAHDLLMALEHDVPAVSPMARVVAGASTTWAGCSGQVAARPRLA